MQGRLALCMWLFVRPARQTTPALHPLNSDGVELFEEFLKMEHSEENLLFWQACERFKKTPAAALTREAEAIFEEFISPQGPKPVSLSLTDLSSAA